MSEQIPDDPPWIVEIDGVKFATPEAVVLLLKAVSEERDQLERENRVLRANVSKSVLRRLEVQLGGDDETD